MRDCSESKDASPTEIITFNAMHKLGLDQVQQAAARIIAEKIRNRTYNFNLYPCEGCGGISFIPIMKVDRYGIPATFSLCTTCALAACNPRLDEKSRLDFYTHHFAELLYGKKNEHECFEHSRDVRSIVLRGVLHQLKEINPGDLILDVGCGNGGVVAALREDGLNAVGIDMHEPSLRYARDALGLPVFEGTLKDALRFINQAPKVIVYMFSLEYIEKIREEFRLVRETMTEDGYLIVVGLRLEKSILSRITLHSTVRFYLIHIFGVAQIRRLASTEGLKLVYHNQGWLSSLRRPQNHSVFVFRKATCKAELPFRWSVYTVRLKLLLIGICGRTIFALRRFQRKLH